MQENQKPLLDHDEQNGTGHIWLIGAVLILALILAWAAFNRSGQDVLPTAVEETEEAGQELEASAEVAAEETEEFATEAAAETRIAAARVEARTELLAVQAKLEAGAAYDEVQEDIDQINTNLASAYANASDEMQSQYQDIKQGLDSFEDSVRNGTGDALESLSNLSLMLETKVRSDE